MSMLKKLATGLAIIGAVLTIAACGAKPDPNVGQKPSDTIELQVASAPRLVPIPVTRTDGEAMECTVAGLKADGRTAAQAKNLAAETTMVTINGVKVALPQGGSYYSLCKGATAEQRLAATQTNLNRTTSALTTANATIAEAQPWIYNDPDGLKVRENTWNYSANQAEERLEAAVAWDVLTTILLIVLFAAFFGAAFRDSIGNWLDRRRDAAPAASN